MVQDVAIIIPTKDRLNWCVLRTRFHVASKFTGHVLFIDSSEINPSAEFIRNTSQLGAKNVTFIHIPNLGIHQAIEYGLRYMQDRCKYAAISGDDDFHLPKGLVESALFLDENPQYFSVCGPAITSRIEIKETRVRVTTSSSYWKKFGLNEKDALGRFKIMVQNYHNLEFALKRIDRYLAILTRVNSDFPSSNFSESTTLELCSAFSIALEGRSAWINTPFLIRGDHERRPNSYPAKIINSDEAEVKRILENSRIASFLDECFNEKLDFDEIRQIRSILDSREYKISESGTSFGNRAGVSFLILRIKRRSRSICIGIRYRKYLKWIH
jgi:glycosyltransferase domain-containing protein